MLTEANRVPVEADRVLTEANRALTECVSCISVTFCIIIIIIIVLFQTLLFSTGAAELDFIFFKKMIQFPPGGA